MAKAAAATMLGAWAILSLTGVAHAQPTMHSGRPETAAPAPARATFKCQDGSQLNARFDTRDDAFVAIVDAGDGPHALPARPQVPGPVKLVWSDGDRTLTWSPGVQIMWMDRAGHRMCGGAGHRH